MLAVNLAPEAISSCQEGFSLAVCTTSEMFAHLLAQLDLSRNRGTWGYITRPLSPG